MFKFILRVTRKLTSGAIGLHVATLRKTVEAADHARDKANSRTESAKIDLDIARSMVKAARQNIRDCRADEIRADTAFRNTRLAAEGEAKFFGRDL